MAEDRYRLAPVRDARARDERVRRGELAAAVGDARDTEAKCTHLRARLDAARAALGAAIAARPVTGAATRLALADRFIARCRRDVGEAALELDRAETAHAARIDVVDTARGTLARARAEREVIERHFARWREQRAKLVERRED